MLAIWGPDALLTPKQNKTRFQVAKSIPRLVTPSSGPMFDPQAWLVNANASEQWAMTTKIAK